jgi:DNA-binding response OmpR family regulator
MPNLDGPGMLAKMRESGSKTPVLMLTSESKTAIVATCMRLGISDFVLKPFKGDELKAKVLKALKLPADYAPPAGGPADISPAIVIATAIGATPAAASAKRALVIDDMENVHKKMRSLIPAERTLDTSLNATDGLALCRTNSYGLVLIDGELPDTNLTSVTKQVRLLQPKAVLVAMVLRTANNVTAEMRAQGFDDVLFKPFANDAVEALLERSFQDDRELVSAEENCVRLAGFRGHDDKLDGYFQKISTKLKEIMSKLAEACFDSAVLDASQLPLGQPMRVAQFMADLSKVSADCGVTLRLVGSAELATVMKGFDEAKSIRLFQSVEEARAAA